MYCPPENPQYTTDQSVQVFERKLKLLAPQHVRIFAEFQWWQPRHPSSASSSSPGEGRGGGLAFNSEDLIKQNRKQSFFKMLDLAQTAGATVNVTFWHGPYPHPEKDAQACRDAIKEILLDRHFTNVQYVTIQNEINLTKLPLEPYLHVYKSFDRDLRAAGLRDKVKIIGGDLYVHDSPLKWFNILAANLADVLDGYSVHLYSEYDNPAHMDQRLTMCRDIVDHLPANARKPLYLMEFNSWSPDRPGVGRSGFAPNGQDLYDTYYPALQNSRFILQALNHGYVAAVDWETCDSHYGPPGHQNHDNSKWGLMAGGKDLFRLRPVYYTTWLFTHTSRPGDQVISVASTSTPPQLDLTALRNPDNHLVIYALNTNPDTSRQIDVASLPSSTLFHVTSWSSSSPLQLTDQPSVSSTAAGHLLLTLPPESLTAFSSRQAE